MQFAPADLPGACSGSSARASLGKFEAHKWGRYNARSQCRAWPVKGVVQGGNLPWAISWGCSSQCNRCTRMRPT